MDKRIQQASEWLKKEMEKDEVELKNHKTKTIEEIKQLDKSKMFISKPNKRVSIYNKLLRILGYGKKG